MKRKKIYLSAAVLLTLLIGMSIPVAASTRIYEENYCGVCNAALVSNATHVEHYNSTHKIYYVVDGDKKEETCNVAHSVDRINKYCPTHGFRWSGKRHMEGHTNVNCPYYSMVVYFE